MIKFLSKLRSAAKQGGSVPAYRPARAAERKSSSAQTSDRAILMFEETGQVIRAEAALKEAGFKVQVKAPPAALRTGCDLVIEFALVHSPAVLSVLTQSRLKYLQMLPVSDELLEPVSVYQHKDYGDHLMVRAANMKISVEKTSGLIVNVSGGGCPDVPYLAKLLVGKTLAEALPPLEQGQTLCGYALQLAFDEAKNALADLRNIS